MLLQYLCHPIVPCVVLGAATSDDGALSFLSYVRFWCRNLLFFAATIVSWRLRLLHISLGKPTAVHSI